MADSKTEPKAATKRQPETPAEAKARTRKALGLENRKPGTGFGGGTADKKETA